MRVRLGRFRYFPAPLGIVTFPLGKGFFVLHMQAMACLMAGSASITNGWSARFDSFFSPGRDFFCGGSPLTIRVRLGRFRYFPAPLGVVTFPLGKGFFVLHMQAMACLMAGSASITNGWSARFDSFFSPGRDFFCGESPRTMRVRLGRFRYFPAPLGVVTFPLGKGFFCYFSVGRLALKPPQPISTAFSAG